MGVWHEREGSICFFSRPAGERWSPRFLLLVGDRERWPAEFGTWARRWERSTRARSHAAVPGSVIARRRAQRNMPALATHVHSLSHVFSRSRFAAVHARSGRSSHELFRVSDFQRRRESIDRRAARLALDGGDVDSLSSSWPKGKPQASID